MTPAQARDFRGPGILRDDEVVGLQLIVSNAGKKRWFYYHRVRSGKERRPKLGNFPAMSLGEARRAAKDIAEKVAKGEDPSAAWQAERAAPTVAELCDKYLNEWGPKHNSSRTLKENRHLIECHIRPGLGRYKVAEVTREDVDSFLDDVLNRRYVDAARRERDGIEQAPSAANHVRTLLRHLFNLARDDFRWSIQKVDGESINPVRKTVKQHIEQRQRLAEPAELRAILTLLGEHEDEWPAHVAAIWTLFFSGGRVGEIEKAAKAALDGNRIVLKKHKTFKKIGTKPVRLPSFIVEMIGKLDVEGDRLFGEIALKRFWGLIREKAGCPDLQMRDARRTFASYALQCGFTLDAIGKLLGHTNIRTTGGYTWLVEELSGERNEMVERIAAEMLSTLKPSPSASPSPSEEPAPTAAP